MVSKIWRDPSTGLKEQMLLKIWRKLNKIMLSKESIIYKSN